MQTIPSLAAVDLSKRYDDNVALADVSFEAEGGEIVVLLGPNGSGKSTLLSILAGIERPDTGAVAFNDVLVVSPGRSRLRTPEGVGFVSQRISVYPGLSVWDNMFHFSRLVCGRAGGRREAERCLELFRLERLANVRCNALSGGQVRRLHVAIGVVGSPGILILDEPTAGMDLGSKELTLKVLQQLATEGHIVILSTHDLMGIEPMDPLVLVLVNGALKSCAKASEMVGDDSVFIVEFDGDSTLSSSDMFEVVKKGAGIWVCRTELTCSPMKLLNSLSPADRERVVSFRVLPPSLERSYSDLIGQSGA